MITQRGNRSQHRLSRLAELKKNLVMGITLLIPLYLMAGNNLDYKG